MPKLEEIKHNNIHNEILKVFSGKRVLFLENDFGLYHADGNLEIWLIENKIQYNVLFNVRELNIEYIKKQLGHMRPLEN